MFEQILKELKTRYKDLGLGDSILEAYAKKLDKAVKEEAEIENAVADVESDLKILQTISDQNRTLKAEIKKLQKPTDSKNESESLDTNSNPAKEGEQNPLTEILNELKTLKTEITSIRTEKVNQTNEQKLVSKLKELGVNENFYRLQIAGKTFENDEHIEEFAKTVKASEDAYLQETNNARIKEANPPQFGTQVKEGEVSPEVQAFIKSKQPTNEQH